MTIETIHYVSDIYVGKVFCYGDGHRYQPTHLAMEHNGYVEKIPLSGSQMQRLQEAAQKHDRETQGKHHIVIGLFAPKKIER